MVSLPVIVGFGGISPAGRSSNHQAYKRLVIENLAPTHAKETWLDLAMLMNLLHYREGGYHDAHGQAVNLEDWIFEHKSFIADHTLIRRLESNLFDPQAIPRHAQAKIGGTNGSDISFVVAKRDLPGTPPANWSLKPNQQDPSMVDVHVSGSLDLLFRDQSASKVNSAGQLPSGFNPAELYPSRSHPRGLQLTIYAASDAIQSMGIEWETVLEHVSPDQVGVYASSSMSQLDELSNGGMLQAHLKGKRVSSKQCALAFPEMPADFVNAYVVGSIGGTGGNVGACATFLYNLRQGMEEIRSGRKRVVIVGDSEAPLLPEVIEGYRSMGALAQDKNLLSLDKGATEVDHRRACRPFSTNCGFTLAESAQFVVLFDDQLAVELGATVYGAVGDVFVNADGFKKSISSPGIGNYLTMAKAVALTRAIIGEKSLVNTYVHAHGTGTPQNRVTESHILNKVAQSFGLNNWPVAAIKSTLGHSLAVAAGDQLFATLGAWEHGWIPGIPSIDHIADDVHDSHLQILKSALQIEPTSMDAALLNAKGFGGNNASASILAPHLVNDLLTKRHGKAAFCAYQGRNEKVRARTEEHNQATLRGETRPIYHFGEDVKGEDDVEIRENELKVSGFANSVDLNLKNPYR